MTPEPAPPSREPALADLEAARPAEPMRVGLVGLGRLGAAIGTRLLDCGFELTVHNRTASKAAPLLAAGATWAGTPAAASEASDVVLTVLLDERAVTDSYCGPIGLLAPSPAGRVFVDISTIRTATTLEIAAAVRRCGSRLVDAPVAGPPQAALAGQLLVLAGGAAEDVRTVGPVLSAIGRRVVHLGPTGAGATMKLVLMTSMAVYFAGLSEALAMGSQLGLGTEPMLDVILDSHGAPPVLRDRAASVIAEAAGERAPVSFPVSGVRKDLEAVLATATAAGVPAAAAAAAYSTFTAAASAGRRDRDLASVVSHVLELSSSAVPHPVLAEAMWS